jgi:heptosyltransferase-2
MTKILIEIPTWLGDAVMTTPAIENIVRAYPQCELTLFGSFVSTRLFLHHPNVKHVVIDESKKEGNRYVNLYRLAKQAGSVDLAFSFRKNFTTKFFLWFVDAQKKYIYRRYSSDEIHQVIRYNDFINRSLKRDSKAGKLKIYLKEEKRKEKLKEKRRPLLGINPGATYGSAKRWYPEAFANVAISLVKKYDIVLFGGKGEADIAKDIEERLIASQIFNYTNLAGKTSVEELIEGIAQLDLFITNDSGPMHVAAAFGIPTVCIFGPTRHLETHQWMNDTEILLRKEMACAPCMKRVCPLKHHECMKLITAADVLAVLEEKGFL